MKNSNLSHYHSYSWIFNKNSDIEQSHLNNNHRNVHTLVIENTPRSGLKFERVDGIDYQNEKITKLGGKIIIKKLLEFVKNKKLSSEYKKMIVNAFFGQYSLILQPSI